MFKIEEGFDAEIASRRGDVSLTAMNLCVGQSFLVPNEYGANRGTIAVALTRLSKKTGFKFITRKADGGIRIGRVS